MRNIFTTIYFLGFVLSAFAQEEKIIVIDRGTGKTYKEKRERILVDSKSVMKYSPLQMVVGEINFGYERKIDEMSSVEFEFGPTLSNVGLTVTDNHYNDPFGGSYVEETSKLGFFGSVGYRFYPMDNGKVLNGFYVSPVLKYRLMNFGIHDYSENLDDTQGSENHMYFTFNFGVQRWLSQNFSLDMFGGIGLGYESHMRFNTAATYDGNTGIYSYYWDRKSFDGVRFVFTGGVKIGIGR
jgi:hypothetical protein